MLKLTMSSPKDKEKEEIVNKLSFIINKIFSGEWDIMEGFNKKKYEAKLKKLKLCPINQQHLERSLRN